MIELQLIDIQGSVEESFKKIDLVQKNTTIFLGDLFETDANLSKVRNFLTDFFGSNHQEKVIDIEYSINFVITVIARTETLVEVHFGKYSHASAKVESIGLSMTLKVDRCNFAAEEVMKEAVKHPKLEKKTALRKVEEKTETGEHLARVHVKQQDLKTLQLKKIRKRFGDNKRPEKRSNN